MIAHGKWLRLSYWVLCSLPVLFLLVFFFYPLGVILVSSLQWTGRSSIPSLGQVARLLWFTTWQAAVSTLLTLAIALPGASVFARYRFPAKSVLQALTTVPFVMPTLVVATAFVSLIGPNGLANAVLQRLFGLSGPALDIQHTIWVILLAHVFYNYSVVLRLVGTFWGNLNPALEESARVLGAGRWRAWREVVLPQLAPAVVSAALLTFLFCFTSFGVVMILGGPRFATIEVEIYRQTAQMLNLPFAALLALLQLVITFAITSAYTALQRRTARPLQYHSAQATQRAPGRRDARVWVAANVGLMSLLLLAPLTALVWRSLTLGGTFTLSYYTALAADPGRSYFYVSPPAAVRNSLVFGAATVALSLILGTLGAYLLAGRTRSLHHVVAWLDPLLILPLGASALTLGLGYLIAFGHPSVSLVSSPALVPLAHSLIAFPFVLRAVLPALRGIRPSLREAAAVLGSTPSQVWRAIDLPMLTRALGTGAVYAFTISVGEFGATLLLARPEYATIPVLIYRYLSRPGIANAGQALSMSTILMGICTLGFLLIERLEPGHAGSF